MTQNLTKQERLNVTDEKPNFVYVAYPHEKTKAPYLFADIFNSPTGKLNQGFIAGARLVEYVRRDLVPAPSPSVPVEVADELASECQRILNWFEGMKQKQFDLLVKPGFEKACENWDEATKMDELDFTTTIAALSNYNKLKEVA